jgi:chorismate mutase-like protein
MAEPPPEIAAMRAAIDEVDHALLELCARRREVVASMFAAKRALGLPLLDPAREADLLAERRAFAARVGVPEGLAEKLFRALLEGSHAEMNQR